MLGRTDSRTRAILVLLVFVLVAGSLGVRLAYWQVVRRDELAADAQAQSALRDEIPAQRGAIYDRTGTVVLATSVERDRLAANPSVLTPARRLLVAQTLIAVLGLSGDAATTLRDLMTSDKQYVVLAHDLLPGVSEEIRRLRSGTTPALSGVVLEPEEVRVYPQPGGGPDTSLAAQLLGFVNRDGQGQYGVEQYYQDQLSGLPRVVIAQRDTAGNLIPDTSAVLDPGLPGQNLTLTIDASLQFAVEQELLSTWIADRAQSASAVVIDPYTGEVYAYASYPSYDANAYSSIASSDPAAFLDPIASSVYEPGSVFKLLTAIAALGNGTVTLTTKIRDSGTLVVDGGKAHVSDADHKAMGMLTFQDGVAWSRNVVASRVALKLGKTTAESSQILYDTWRKMGFGSPTGIDVANEIGGILRDPSVDPWHEIDLANGSFGQGIAVTPIQLAQAYAAMVNGGILVQPRVVKAIGAEETQPIDKGQVITPQMSVALKGLLNHVVTSVPFYSSRTLIPGFDVGGKSGTAQIWDAAKGDWKVNMFNYSFIGYIGRQKGHPDLVVAVRIEEGTPTVIRQGYQEMPVMSFELFRRIAHDAITTPDLIPDPQAAPVTAVSNP